MEKQRHALHALHMQARETVEVAHTRVLHVQMAWSTSPFLRRAIVFGGLQIACVYTHFALALSWVVTTMLFGGALALAWRFVDPMPEWERRTLSAVGAFSILLYFIEQGFTTALSAPATIALIALVFLLIVRTIGVPERHTRH